MTSDRETILARVRDALAPLKERAPLPDWDTELAIMRRLVPGHEPWTLFRERLVAVNGLPFDSATALAAWLREHGHRHGYCDPALWPRLAGHFGEGFTVETDYDRARVDDYQFGITAAAGAVAETGTLILDDGATTRRLAALTPWVHIAVLSRSTIFADLQQAVAAMGGDPNIIWCTGPSKTADVEGILIEGVHGPGVQIALLLD
jgi:L-lactate dehydrogenase complex protein LldG